MRYSSFCKSGIYTLLFVALISFSCAFGIKRTGKADIVKPAPYISHVSDAVRAGDTVNLTGNYLNGNLKIAYAENKGVSPGAFDPDAEDVRYIDKNEFTFYDDVYGTGLSFIFPYSEKSGLYDIWVYNVSGWSNAFTLNAARPLYIASEAAYGGQNVEIIGRNFMTSEFTDDTEEVAFSHIGVKLESSSDVYFLTETNGGILTGKKCGYDYSATDDDIYYTNPFRITIKIPQEVVAGEYSVYVKTHGEDYRSLEEPQTLTVVSRKSQSWNETVFGGLSGHVGNDPLDLGVYWAQDLKYGNVYTVSANTMTGNAEQDLSSAASLSGTVNSRIRSLSETNGGGVIYFPAGEYYLTSLSVYDNVILVGAGTDKTFLYSVKYRSEDVVNTGNFISGYGYTTGNGGESVQVGRSNIGIARLTIADYSLSTATPAAYINFPSGSKVVQTEDYAWRSASHNKFLKDVVVNGNADAEKPKASVIVAGDRNCVIKDTELNNCTSLTCESYSYLSLYNVKFYGARYLSGTPALQAKYTTIENCIFDENCSAHGPSIKSETYIAHSITLRSGNRVSPTNDGEVILMELASGMFATGNVCGASSHGITLEYLGVQEGGVIDENTVVRWNNAAVVIVEGTGTGQMRYISQRPQSADEATGVYEYNLASYERDWDILPDSDSKFTIISPIQHDTVYKYKAEDCVSTICVYGNHRDTVVYGCELKDTAGISVASMNQKIDMGRLNPVYGVRIENNSIEGVSPWYDNGTDSATAQQGGITVQVRSPYVNGYVGALAMDVVIKNNTLNDLIPNVQRNGYSKSGIVFYLENSTRSTVQTGDLRYVIVENNRIENSVAGIFVNVSSGSYCAYTGFVARNNDISGVSSSDYLMNIGNGSGKKVSVSCIFHDVDGTVYRELSYNDYLPNGDKTGFLGWYDANGIKITRVAGYGKTEVVARYKVELTGTSLTLDGTIGLNFYLNIDDTVISNGSAKVVFTFHDDTTEEREIPNKESNGLYKFTVRVAPKDVYNPIGIKLICADQIYFSAESGVSAYFDRVINDSTTYEKLYPLIIALKNYCDAAKAYFSGENVSENQRDITDVIENGYAYVKPILTNGAEYYSSSIVLRATTALRIYLKTFDPASVNCSVNGERCVLNPTNVGGIFFIEVGEISATEIDAVFTVNINGTEFTYGAFNYVYLALRAGTNHNLINLLKFLYEYNEQAEIYFA